MNIIPRKIFLYFVKSIDFLDNSLDIYFGNYSLYLYIKSIIIENSTNTLVLYNTYKENALKDEVTEKAKSKLKKYIKNVEKILNSTKNTDKISEVDRNNILSTIKLINEWIDYNINAEKEEYEEKLLEITSTINPIIDTIVNY